MQRLLACLLFALPSCGSGDPVEMRVFPGAITPAPQFSITGSEPPRSLFVDKIAQGKRDVDPQRTWTLMRLRGKSPSWPMALTYSQVPAGYAAAAPAAMLTPGAYQLVALSGGRRWVLDFHVRIDGSVHAGFRQPVTLSDSAR